MSAWNTLSDPELDVLEAALLYVEGLGHQKGGELVSSLLSQVRCEMRSRKSTGADGETPDIDPRTVSIDADYARHNMITLDAFITQLTALRDLTRSREPDLVLGVALMKRSRLDGTVEVVCAPPMVMRLTDKTHAAVVVLQCNDPVGQDPLWPNEHPRF